MIILPDRETEVNQAGLQKRLQFAANLIFQIVRRTFSINVLFDALFVPFNKFCDAGFDVGRGLITEQSARF